MKNNNLKNEELNKEDLIYIKGGGDITSTEDNDSDDGGSTSNTNTTTNEKSGNTYQGHLGHF